ncbi:MAG: M15 family metallopeptidase, partial [Sulfurovaceae bacterium]|nr:M15 family metallopeptidase [Sulfurovaceae bacterium]
KNYYHGCPVEIEDLRIVNVKYYNFENKIKNGDLIVHKDASSDVVKIFDDLFAIKYPIRQIVPIHNFNSNDFASIEADNTSAFNCRKATGENSWSKHAYGKAIDINPIENPFIFKDGHTAHDKSLKFKNRIHKNLQDPQDIALLLPNDEAVKIFAKHGWGWGGSWSGTKDYQHFYKIEK